jgi:hypothetical protein
MRALTGCHFGLVYSHGLAERDTEAPVARPSCEKCGSKAETIVSFQVCRSGMIWKKRFTSRANWHQRTYDSPFKRVVRMSRRLHSGSSVRTSTPHPHANDGQTGDRDCRDQPSAHSLLLVSVVAIRPWVVIGTRAIIIRVPTDDTQAYPPPITALRPPRHRKMPFSIVSDPALKFPHSA